MSDPTPEATAGAIVDVRTTDVLGQLQTSLDVTGCVDDVLRFVPYAALAGLGTPDERPDVVPILGPDDLDEETDGPAHRARLLAVRAEALDALLGLGDLRCDYIVLGDGLTQVTDPTDDDAAVVAAFATFARRRSMGLIATGVVDQLRFDVLRSLGVTHAAGPHVDRRLQVDPSPDFGRTAQERARCFRLDLDASTTLPEVAAVVCEHVIDLGLLPSIYLESHGLMRCLAQRGYWQVMDGIPVDRGVVGRTFRTGRAQLVDARTDPNFIGAVPGLAAEATVPLRVGGTMRGVLSVESTRPFVAADHRHIARVGSELERAMQRVEFHLADGAVHRLARATAELATLDDEHSVAHAAVRLACRVSLMSSAMIAVPFGSEPIGVRAAQGPLAGALRAVQPRLLAELAEDLIGVSSCISGGDEDGQVRPALESLRTSGSTAVGAFPVECGGSRGLLIVADHAPGELDGELREAMELLAGAVGRAFDHVRLVTALRTRAQRDHLTSVGNRGAFEDFVDQLESQPVPSSGDVAVLLADLDGFKGVNDRFGHHVGDQVLVETAREMAAALRPDDCLFRIGGDEFAIVLPGVDDETAELLAQRICQRVRPILQPHDASLSIGIALRSGDESIADCLRRADHALYQVKRNGSGTARLATSI